MDKKSMVLVGLCVVLLLFWGKIQDTLFPQPEQPLETGSPGASQPVAVDSATQNQFGSATPTTPIRQAEGLTGQVVTDKAPVVLSDTVSRETYVVTTPLVELTFSNYGGGIQKIVFKKYDYYDSGAVVLIDDPNRIVPDVEIPGHPGYLAGRAFACDRPGFNLSETDSPRTITFTCTDGEGGTVIKKFTISPDRYDIGFELIVDGFDRFRQVTSYLLDWKIPNLATEPKLGDDYDHFKVTARVANELVDYDDFENGVLIAEEDLSTTWVGMQSKYFAAVMISRGKDANGMVARGKINNIQVNGDSYEARELGAGLKMRVETVGAIRDSFALYAGPLHYNTLKSYGIDLEEMKDLGWPIIKPFSIAIIWLLPKIHSVFPNYGLVVLVFAFLIKLITYPLTRKQTLAMAKMKELAPKQKKLQEKFKNDPKRLNKEMMKLYKKTGANPLSGCLPILPQMPLFFALFSVFKSTIEFRGAGFLGWITDLSMADPLYILPVIMVATMFIQQKMTMTDPKNKMMVYMMPLFFGWLFMSFPAGLVLYWTGFNVLSLVETIFIKNRQKMKEGSETVVIDGE